MGILNNLSPLLNSIWDEVLNNAAILTLILLAWTAIEGFRSRRSSNKANMLVTLPFFVLKFETDTNGNYVFSLKNLRDSPAYDIKVEKWHNFVLDIKNIWTMEISPDSINAIDGKSTLPLITRCYANGILLPERGSPLIVNSYLNNKKGTPLKVVFKNVLGKKYITEIYPDYDEVDNIHRINISHAPKEVTFLRRLGISAAELLDVITGNYLKLIWKLEGPTSPGMARHYNPISAFGRILRVNWKKLSNPFTS